MEIEKKLKELGFELPNPPTPAANYIGYVRVGNLLFIGGNIGRINGVLKYRGKVGDTVTLEQAYEASRNCALNHLATMKAALGDLDKVERIVKVLELCQRGARIHRHAQSRERRVRFIGSTLGRARPAHARGGGYCVA